jgi:dTDP-4-dehydrorhamnose reductase
MGGQGTGVLVTGCNGMLGAALCKAFSTRERIVGLHRDKVCYAVCTENFSVDLLDGRQLAGIIKAVRPRLVIHCAALVDIDACEDSPDSAYQANVQATFNLLRACDEVQKVIYISTDQVYGRSVYRTEGEVKLRPLNVYGETKYEGERLVLRDRPENLVIRTNIFGSSVKPGKVSSVEWIRKGLTESKPLNLFTNYVFSTMYTESLGEVLIRLVGKNSDGIYNVAAQPACSKFEFGHALAREMGENPELILPTRLTQNKGRVIRAENISMPVDKLQKSGVEIPSLPEEIRRYLRTRD